MPDRDTAFKEAYAKLNPRQKEAVDALYGPVMVIAGPGTGKTQILAVRIANILKTVPHAKPDEIVAITYTESAVASMRTRLAGLIGAAAYRVRIHTFHGFARTILDFRPDLFPRITEGTRLSDVRAIALIESLLDAGSYTRIRSAKDPYRAVRRLISFISNLKREHYTPDSYKAELEALHKTALADPDRIHEKGAYKGKEKDVHRKHRERIEKHLEVAELFAAYEDALQKGSLYDYDDLITEAVRGLETNEDFRADVGERMQFILADEHQDANQAQNRLLELASDFDGKPNLFIVGDEKQAIYRFQGASLASFFYFKEKYPEAELVLLTDNYRSTDEILAAAGDLIAPAPIPDPALRAALKAVNGKGIGLQVAACDTPQEERAAIAAHIEKLHAAGVAYTDIAIITRKNSDVLRLAGYLRSIGIAEDHFSAELDALDHPAIRLFIELIRAAANMNNDAALTRALFIPGFPAPMHERIRLLGLPRDGRRFVEVLRTEGSTDVRSWLRAVEHVALDLPATPALEWLARLATESRYLEGLLALAESEGAYEAYEGFMEEVRILGSENPSATATDMLARLSVIELHELPLKRARTQKKGVNVMTAHHAKGMEFIAVIVAFATDECWIAGKRDEFSLLIRPEEDEHDIRRLFYVALTRAKQDLLISYAVANEEGRAQTPLRFIADISEHVEDIPPPSVMPKTVPYAAKTILDTEFLTERLIARGFSPTGFNNYKVSPWRYLFRTLLQIPDAPNRSMQFGTAIHYGLKCYADALAQGNATVKTAIVGFRNELGRLPLSERDRAGLFEKGEEALTTYLESEAPKMTRVERSEFSVSIPLVVPGLGTIPLTGKLDRLDRNVDDSFTVIDYKTGVAKSENDLRGLTKSGNGDYYRQLIYYKLLLDRDGRYPMSRGSIHFVEPTDSGKTVVRDFVITKEETDALESELIAAAQAIADGSAFSAMPTEEEVGEYLPVVERLIGKGLPN